MQKVLFALIIIVSYGLQAYSQNYYGTGADGALVVSINDTVYLDDSRTHIIGNSVAGDESLLVNDASLFNQGDEIMLIIMYDNESDSATNTAGAYEFKTILTIVDNHIFVTDGLQHNYPTNDGVAAQIVKVAHYTDVTVHGYITCHDWDGYSGGIVAFRANGTILISADGMIDATGSGYMGRNRQSDNNNGYQGNGLFGVGIISTSYNGNGGGGGTHAYAGGGGGGHAFQGSPGGGSGTVGEGGYMVGEPGLSKLYMGGSGGTGGDNDSNAAQNPNSGSGGGIIYITGNIFNNLGIVRCNGTNGTYGGSTSDPGSGGGAGGSILLGIHSLLNDSIIEAAGGLGHANSYPGGNGSVGRIAFETQSLTDLGSVVPSANTAVMYGIFHSELFFASTTAGPYTANAYVIDEQGDAITNVSIYYRINNGSYSSIPMTLMGTYYSADIPGQAANSTIDYYISATDGTDSYFYPMTAPANYVSFDVTGLQVSNLSLSDNMAGSVEVDWEVPIDVSGLVDYKVYRSEIPGFIAGPSNLLTSTGSTQYNDNTVMDFHTYYYRVAANWGFNMSITDTVSILVNNTSLTTVLGYAFLEGQSNHANIMVKFHPISPSAVLDSTYTNALGYFETTVVPGTYDVSYEKINYQTYYREENFSIIADHDFGESTILQLGTTDINGNVSGIWDGIYTITGDITIPNGDSLTILSGSEIRFLGNYNIFVYGFLEILGEAGDSVLFTSAPHNQIFGPGQWKGIDFYDASDDQSTISYAIIRYAEDGLYFEEAMPTVNDCKIHTCSDRGIQLNGNAAGINLSDVEIFDCYDGFYNYDASPTIDGLYSHHNSRYGLMYDYSSYGTITNSTFTNNSDRGMYLYNYASPHVTNCSISNNNSWGIDIRRYSSPRIEDCEILNNSGYGICVGYDGYGWHSTEIVDCLVEGNTSWAIYLRHYCTVASELSGSTIRNNGGGVYVYYQIDGQIYNNLIVGNNNTGIYMNANNYSDTYIHHNIIAYNNGDGIYRSNHAGDPTIEYNTIVGNSDDGFENNRSAATINFNSNIVVNNNGYGIRNNQSIAIFEYNDVYSNAIGEISNTSNLPVNAWDFVSFNANSDSADIYLNISEDPLFVFNDSIDFHLTSASPCINTGNPGNPDPDGTTADLGAFFFESGYPHSLYFNSYADQSVNISWDSVSVDTLVAYKVYYKLNSASNYSYFATTSNLNADVTGLTNDSLYDFTVSGIYPNFESGFAPKVSGVPGVPEISFNPYAFNLTLTGDTLIEDLEIINNGSKELSVFIPQGTANKALHFDGYYDYLYASDPAHLEGMTEFTIECWIYREDDGHMGFFGKHYKQFQVYINSNNYLGMYKGYTIDNYEGYTSGYYVPMQEWHHIAITWEGSVIKFYVDGQFNSQVDQVPDFPIPNLTYNFELGCRAHDHNYFFTGFLSEARIWNYARSALDIATNMNVGLTGSETGLLGYWPLKDNYNDYSSYGLNLTGTGNIYFADAGIASVNDEIPYYLPNGQYYSVPAAGSINVPFGFLNTGQTGTYIYTQQLFTNIPAQLASDYEIALTFGQTIPSTPVHFTPVDSTGLPYNIIVTNAEIDGITLAVGDEIGVCDGSFCVGAGIFDGNFNFALTVWEADPGQGFDGYTSGNEMSFVIYDASADLEATVEANYEVGDGTFGFGIFTACELISTVYKIQQVAITPNIFNLVSFNKLPRYSNSETVFGGVEDLQIVYNDNGYAWIPPYNINSLGDINFKDGYHLFSTSIDTIFYEGTLINAMSWPIHVEAGKWNSIAYLGENEHTVGTAIESTIVDSIDIMQNSAGGAWIPSLSINTLGYLTPGTGYQIALSSPNDIDITYQVDNTQPAKTELPQIIEPTLFDFTPTGLPYQIVIELPNAAEFGLLPMDELAVYNGDLCVGAAVYTGQSRMLLTAWSAASKQAMKGFTEGEIMTFKAQTARHGLIQLKSEALNANNNVTFKGANYAHIALTHEVGSSTISCYPNPFKSATKIHLSIIETEQVHMSIMDLSGKVINVILNDKLDKGTYSFEWTGANLPKGVYILEIRTGDQISTQKLIKI